MNYKRLLLRQFDGFLFPFNYYKYDKFKEAINYKPTSDDIFVVSYPKSGTTWTQYIVWEILNDAKEPPFVNEMWYTSGAQIELIGSKEMAEIGPQPRLIKSHLSFNYIPFSDEAKYIYIARNPFEVCLSFYKDIKRTPGFCGEDILDFDDFVNSFVNGYTPFGDYFDHVLSWYSQRNRPNVFLLTYEQLKTNHKEYVLKIAQFMGKQFSDQLFDNNILDKIVYYTDFEYMRTIPFIMVRDSKVAEKNGLDPGKNLELLKTNDYRMAKICNVGKVGHSIDKYNEKQIEAINSMIEQKFKSIPDLIEIWRNCGIKV